MSIVPISEFSSSGVDVGSKSRNLTYLYGLSDFFSFVFEDADQLNLMLEANALQASEIYSRFLQLTSSLTLAGIQEDIGSNIELIFLLDTDKVDVMDPLPRYNVAAGYSSAKFLANRPFLPTATLQEGVDFRITQTGLNSCVLQFARPLFEYGFSQRILPDGSTQYAIWATDVAIDEQLIYKYYGKILGVLPEVSSEQFSNFVYGLYYLYFNGPTLKVLSQGLNLVLGIPLSRSDSTVLDMRVVVETGQYLVITDDKEYLLPLGVTPAVGIGDEVSLGTPIAQWIELKDFTSDGKWWLNVSIPSEVIRSKPHSQLDRFASAGTRFDQLMTDYLYRNTFLIRVNVGSFTNSHFFSYLPDIISKGKPSHAQPVFVWRIDLGEYEIGTIEEIGFTILQVVNLLKSINSVPINQAVIN